MNENALAVIEAKSLATRATPYSFTPSNLAEAMDFARMVAASDLVPPDYKSKPGNVLVAMQLGAELGLPPLQAVQGIAVVNGRPAVWGDHALAIVKASPVFEAIEEALDESGSSLVARCRVKRRGAEWVERSFSKADAETAGLWTKAGTWKQYPKRMLQMRARSFALRDVFPDVLKGLRFAEEMADVPGEPVVTETVPMPRRASEVDRALPPAIETAVVSAPPAEAPSPAPDAPAPTNGNGKRGPEEVVLVKDVREAEDAKGKKWAVDTMDGRSFLTRYGKLAEDAKVAKELDAPVRISYHVGTGGGFVLDSLAPAPDDDKPVAPSAA